MDAIVAENICKDYYEYKVLSRGKLLTHALNNVSFTVEKGDFFGLLGNNGAGKSTLMKVLTTNLTKTSGSAIIMDYNLDTQEREIKKRISWMFGVDYVGVSWSSIEKNMELAAAFMGLEPKLAKKEIEILLKEFDLWENRKLDVWRMSTGMQGKYSLAVAMLKRPEILFLDEPTRGLDVEAKEELTKLLKKMNEEGVTVFYTSHELNEVEKLCKNLLIIEKGEVKYIGGMHELKRKNKEVNTLFIDCVATDINKILLDLKRNTKFISDYEIQESHDNMHRIKIYSPYETTKILVTFARLLEKKGVIVEKINAGSLHLEDVFKKILNPEKHKEKIQELKNFEKAEEHPEMVAHYLHDCDHPDVCAAACVTFWKYKRTEVEAVLKEMLGKDRQNIIAAANAIGNIKTDEFNDVLSTLASSSDKDVKNAAAIALAKNGNNEYTNLLLKMMLQHDTSQDILMHVSEMHKDVIDELTGKIHKLSYADLSFLHHQLQHLGEKERELVLKLLRIKHKTYEDWEKEH